MAALDADDDGGTDSRRAACGAAGATGKEQCARDRQGVCVCVCVAPYPVACRTLLLATRVLSGIRSRLRISSASTWVLGRAGAVGGGQLERLWAQLTSFSPDANTRGCGFSANRSNARAWVWASAVGGAGGAWVRGGGEVRVSHAQGLPRGGALAHRAPAGHRRPRPRALRCALHHLLHSISPPSQQLMGSVWEPESDVVKSTWKDSETPLVPVGIFRSVSLDVCVGTAACTRVSQSGVCGTVGVCAV